MKKFIFISILFHVFYSASAQESGNSKQERLETHIRELGKYYTQRYFSNDEARLPLYQYLEPDTFKAHKGFADSIKYFYQEKKYLNGIGFLANESFSSKDEILNSAPCIWNCVDIFYYSNYIWGDFLSLKTKQEYIKRIKDKKCDIPEVLILTNKLLFIGKDTVNTADGYNKIINSKCDAYFKKTALLFLGMIKSNEAIKHSKEPVLLNTVSLLNQSFSLLKQGFEINESDFFNLKKKYLNKKRYGLSSGFYLYPEYYQLIQLAYLQEIAQVCYRKYLISNNENDLKLAYDYYFKIKEKLDY